MPRLSSLFVTVLALAATAAAQTRSPAKPVPSGPPPLVQPGAPGEPSREISAEKARDLSKVGFTAADVSFMQGMIHHHAQAVEMVELLKTRTDSNDMRKLGQRIEISQRDEIKMMRQWLQARGQDAPDPLAHDGHAGMAGMHMVGDSGEPLMPGMLTPPQMQQLAAARGREFDRLFLQGMIRHHGGALTMVKDLFASPGAAQDGEMFAFASDVDADQRMEIDRMSAMLRELER
jgi:uncharacterized protein (DUF305 family)